MVILEMVNMVKPDERAVMTYVSCYYHALKGAQKVNVEPTNEAKKNFGIGGGVPVVPNTIIDNNIVSPYGTASSVPYNNKMVGNIMPVAVAAYLPACCLLQFKSLIIT